MRIIFLGTPDFAVASLNALIQHKFDVVAVVTAPDKPAGRGMKLQQSAVKKYALEHNIPVLQPEKLKDPNFLDELKSFQADLQVVVAFRMLPEVVWNMPPLGTINVHASLLPNYRGAAPINWAIIRGEKMTGVTTFKLLHQIDTGHILLQQAVDINETDNAGTLHDKLMLAGAELLIQTIDKLVAGELEEIPQNLTDESIQHAPKIYTETCQINWNNPAKEIQQLIRGLSPYPGAFTFILNKKMKIFSAEIIQTTENKSIGEYATDNKTYLHMYASDGAINILELQPEGKTRMTVQDYLRGNKLP